MSSRQYTMREWQEAVLPALREEKFAESTIKNVTLLAYFFWRDGRIDSEFPAIECAFLSAYRCFGLMESVIVTNRITERMRKFAEKYPMRLVVEPELDAADGVKALCIESISKMHERFSTEYVLTLQTDGMPLNPGLGRFVGEYDYIGAPFPGHIYWYDFYPYPRYAVGNGGFSLRSREICEAASVAYKRLSRWLPYMQFFYGDDVFYCKTMPFYSPKWRKRFKYAPFGLAHEFSIGFEHPVPKVRPLGFHSPGGFDAYCRQFGVPFPELSDSQAAE